MKFWSFFGERWLAKTYHLTMTQECIYFRLVNWAMINERPLPASLRDCAAIARCTTSAHREALQFVLENYWVLTPDGWHQGMVDETLEKWKSSIPQVLRTTVSSRVRNTKLRNDRLQMFVALREIGVFPPVNAGTATLRQLCAERNVTPPDAREITETESFRLQVATPLPYTKYQKGIKTGRAPPVLGGHFVPPAPAPFSGKPSENEQPEKPRAVLALAVKAMESAGMSGVFAAHPKLVALIDSGATTEDFGLIAAEAVARRKGFGWALAALAGRRSEMGLNGATAHDPEGANGAIPADLDAALVARFNDPSVSDPFDLTDSRHLPARFVAKGDSS